MFFFLAQFYFLITKWNRRSKRVSLKRTALVGPIAISRIAILFSLLMASNVPNIRIQSKQDCMQIMARCERERLFIYRRFVRAIFNLNNLKQKNILIVAHCFYFIHRALLIIFKMKLFRLFPYNSSTHCLWFYKRTAQNSGAIG